MRESGSNFIRTIIEDDLRTGRTSKAITRFPPEPNGYLHIGHAKALYVAFSSAAQFNGQCHLRMDDTNPEAEDPEFVQGIERDIRWLGFDWGEHRYNASDYFGQLYEWAQHLVREGLAYVDACTLEEIRAQRGTVETAGTNSPHRDRPAAESLALLEEMRTGKYPDGAMVLRAKIDMSHPNMKMRDPIMYRIRNTAHHRTGTDWHIYPMYDWAHGQSDAIEGVTHSTCSLEFDVNRPLYDWYLEHLPVEHKPRQFEFARMNIAYWVMSKRWLKALVDEGHVDGWDDPRMPTLCGLRRRGVPPEAVRAFIDAAGIAKAASQSEPAQLESIIRDHLNHEAPRRMAVLDPVEVVVDEWEGGEDRLEASSWPHDVPKEGSRQVPFTGRVYIERSDFEVEPPKGFKRLAPGRAVRLRYAYIVTCTGYELDDDGRVTRIRVSLDPSTRGGTKPEGVKVWGTLHWVDAAHGVPVEVRQYDRLFTAPKPGADTGEFRDDLNPDSLSIVHAVAEPALRFAAAGEHFQFERVGYFFVDPVVSTTGAPVFNRVVALKDSYSKPAAEPVATPTPSTPEPAPAQARELGAVALAFVARGLSESEAATLEGDEGLRTFFEAAVQVHDNPKGVAGWVVTEVGREAKEGGLEALAFGGDAIGRLVALIDAGTITNAIAKKVFAILLEDGGDPAAIVEAQGLAPITDAEELQTLVDAVLGAHPERVEAYKGGRHGLLGFFVGQVMQRTGGRADARKVKALLAAGLA